MNDRLATVVGMCKLRRTFQTFPIVYTRYSQATLFIPRRTQGVVVRADQPEPGVPSEEVCERINAPDRAQGRKRATSSLDNDHVLLRKTGIPMNFGITVLLGFIVGTAIAGQTFYLFTIENLKQFGALKAMGVGNMRRWSA